MFIESVRVLLDELLFQRTLLDLDPEVLTARSAFFDINLYLIRLLFLSLKIVLVAVCLQSMLVSVFLYLYFELFLVIYDFRERTALLINLV